MVPLDIYQATITVYQYVDLNHFDFHDAFKELMIKLRTKMLKDLTKHILFRCLDRYK